MNTVTDTKSFYSDIDDAPALKSDNWIRPGKYRVRLTEFRPGIRDSDMAKFQVIKYTVEEVLRQESSSQMEGETITHMLNMKWPKNRSRVRHVVSILSDMPQDQVTAAKVAALADHNELVQGMTLIADATNTTTKDGGTFTVVDYFKDPSSSPTDEAIPF